MTYEIAHNLLLGLQILISLMLIRSFLRRHRRQREIDELHRMAEETLRKAEGTLRKAERVLSEQQYTVAWKELVRQFDTNITFTQ